jgi:oligosaccharide repeat unit polymerase
MTSSTHFVPEQDSPIWWLHPVPIFVGLNGLTGIAAFLASPRTYYELWRTPKYFTQPMLLLTIGVIIAFCVGVWLARLRPSSYYAETEWQGSVSFSQALVLFKISFWLTVMAYICWVALGISRGLGLSVLESIFTGGLSVYTMRTYLATVPGITTCTQFDIAAVILGSLIGSAGGWKIVRRKLAIVFLLAVVRALIYSERLAFLELAVPVLVILLADSASWIRPSLRTLVRLAPVMAMGVVYAVFTGFEYFRSWSIYYSARQSSLFLFGLWRLMGYYVTSANNSAFLISSFHHSLRGPYFSFYFLWQFPILNEYVKDIFSWIHLDYDGFMNLLAAGANPEFNNPGGLLSPVIDFGIAGGLVYWVIMGLISGHLYSLYLRKHPFGMCLYPVIFLTLTEVPRYLFWGEGRAFPSLAFLLLSAFLLLRSSRLFSMLPQWAPSR